MHTNKKINRINDQNVSVTQGSSQRLEDPRPLPHGLDAGPRLHGEHETRVREGPDCGVHSDCGHR